MKSPIRHLLVGAMLITAVAACGSDDASDASGTGSVAASEPTDPPNATDGSTEPSDTGPSVAGGTGPTVRWGTSTIPASFDPATVGSSAHQVYMGLVYDSLLYADPSGNLSPRLATEWTMADDGMSLDFTLREGVTFQDGAPLNAEAVVTNFDHLLGPDSLVAGNLGMIESVEAVDDLHVRFVTNRPAGDLPNILAGFAGMMVSPESLAAGTTATEPVGAGPYTVSSATDAMVTFDYWDGYWAADEIVPQSVEVSVFTDDAARLNALKSGQIDAAIIRPNQLAEAEAAGLQTHSVQAATAYGISVNASRPGLDNADVRRAISTAIDRDSINEFLLDGECVVSAQPYPDDHWAFNPEIDESPYITYDPDAARATIDEAVPEGLSLTILVPNVSAYQRLAEVLQEQLGTAGIDAAVEAVDYNETLVRARSGDYDAIVTLLISASPDASTWADVNYRLSPAGDEFLDPALPDLIADSRTSIDPQVRADAIGAVTATALDAGTNQIVICLPSNTFASGANVTGFDINNPREMLVD